MALMAALEGLVEGTMVWADLLLYGGKSIFHGPGRGMKIAAQTTGARTFGSSGKGSVV